MDTRPRTSQRQAVEGVVERRWGEGRKEAGEKKDSIALRECARRSAAMNWA
jgi:hypothetical protein